MAKPAKSAPLSTMSRTLSKFFRWWGSELTALVPIKIKQWWQGADHRLLITFDADKTTVARPGPSGLEQILSLDAAESDGQRAQFARNLVRRAGPQFRLLLAVPPDKILRRAITLPLAVEENLRQTLGFELDRYLPLKPDQVYFDFRIIGRDPAQRQLKIELAAIQRAVIDQGLSRAAMLGVPIAGAILADEINDRNALDFLPAAAHNSKPVFQLGWRIALAALALTLLAGLLVTPIWQKRAAAISLLKPLDDAKNAARETDQLRDRMSKVTDDYRFLVDQKWATPSTVLILEEISKRLTDDTFTTQLDFDGKNVQLQGESGSAANLVELLETSPMFKDVGFKAQLVKIQGTPNDRFHLIATVEADSIPKPMPAASVPTPSPAPPGAPPSAPPAAAPAPPATATPAIPATPPPRPVATARTPALPAASNAGGTLHPVLPGSPAAPNHAPAPNRPIAPHQPAEAARAADNDDATGPLEKRKPPLQTDVHPESARPGARL